MRRDRDRNGGGVCFYIRDSVNFNIREDLTDRSMESVFIEILFPKSRPFLVGVFYRPPTDRSFLDLFREVLSRFDPRDEVYLLGDFNICMKQRGSSLARGYTNILNSFSMTQLIDSPTRITVDSSSILDHVVTNCKDKIVNVWCVGPISL